MKYTMPVRKDSSGNAYLDLKDFKGLVQIKLVKSYSLEEVDDDGRACLVLKFFDKYGNVIKINSESEEE